MKRSSSNIQSRFILIAFLLIAVFTGCDDPGSVDGNIGGDEANISIDTLSVDKLSSQGIDYYSGSFSLFAAGQYDDPLFGNISSKGLFRPSLPLSQSDTLTANAKMLVRLQFVPSQLYGDSLASQDFELYKIDEFWRGNTFLFQDDITLDGFGGSSSPYPFTVDAGADSVDVPLPQSWINDYKDFANNQSDSLYRQDLNGLAIVPKNSKKMLAINTDSSEFIVQNPSADTFSVPINRQASSFKRTAGGNSSAGSTVLHSTNEKYLQLDLDLSDYNVSSQNVARSELVIYRNNDLLTSSLSSEPSSVVRPEVINMRVFFIDPANLPDNITPGSPVANGLYSEDDQAYHFDLTGLVINKLDNVQDKDKKLVVALYNNGAIQSTVVYNNNAPVSKKPKLIVTSLKN